MPGPRVTIICVGILALYPSIAGRQLVVTDMSSGDDGNPFSYVLVFAWK